MADMTHEEALLAIRDGLRSDGHVWIPCGTDESGNVERVQGPSLRDFIDAALARPATSPSDGEAKRLRGIIERERSRVADLVTRLKKSLQERQWLLEGRGSYAWDDDDYRKEFAAACGDVRHVIAQFEPMAHDFSDCPTNAKEVAEARMHGAASHQQKSPGAGGKFDHLPLLTEQELDWHELHQIVLEANGEASPTTIRLWARIFATCRAGLRAAPEGWKLLPVEPTPEMLEAYAEAQWPGDEEMYADEHESSEAGHRAGYAALLTKAPEPPR